MKYDYRFSLNGTGLVQIVDKKPMSYEEIVNTVGLLEYEHGEGVEWECVSHPNLNASAKGNDKETGEL